MLHQFLRFPNCRNIAITLTDRVVSVIACYRQLIVNRYAVNGMRRHTRGAGCPPRQEKRRIANTEHGHAPVRVDLNQTQENASSSDNERGTVNSGDASFGRYESNGQYAHRKQARRDAEQQNGGNPQ
jgi:hypothetical protein